MTQKTISLPEDVCNALKKQKLKGESFSELIHFLIQKKILKTSNLEKR